ncbi:MAG TPA: hypothetical protein VHB48_01955 [Chitinophagaceae bacterium]|nr:hypothetical protein [Chitinophagaceae bacterium]
MGKNIFCLFFSLTASLYAFAQDNPCTADWTDWKSIYSFAPGVDFTISFKYQIHNRKGGDCGQSYFRFNNPVIKKGVYLDISFDYKQKDGTVATNKLGYIELDKPGIRQSNEANWYNGYEVVNVSVKYVDPQKDKAKGLTSKTNTIIQKFDEAYNEAEARLAKLTDAGKKSALQQKLDNIRTAFLQYKQKAQQQLTDGEGDAMTASVQEMEARQADVLNLMNDIWEGPPVNTNTQKDVAAVDNSNQKKLVIDGPKNVNAGSTNNSYAQQFQQWRQQNEQNQQNINNAFSAISNSADQLGGLIVGAKTQFQRRQEKIEKLQAKIQAYHDKIAEEKALDSIFDLQVSDTVFKIAQYMVQDLQLINKSKGNAKTTMDLLTRVCARMMRVNYLRDRKRYEIEDTYHTNDVLHYNINSACSENEQFNLYHLPDYISSGFYEDGIKTADLYTVATIFTNPFRNYQAQTNDPIPDGFLNGQPQQYRQSQWNYAVAFAQLHYTGNNKKESKKFKKNYTAALPYLHALEDMVVDSAGCPACKRVNELAYELNGEILYDSSATSDTEDYLDKAFVKIALSINLCINSCQYGLRHYVGTPEALFPSLGGTKNGGGFFITSFVNLLIVTDKLLASGKIDDLQKQGYLDGCVGLLNQFIVTQNGGR